jgi:hypothetical protein
MGKFDQPGQHRALLEYVASLPGMDYKTAEDYVGPEQPRLTEDDQFATMENSMFQQGQAVPVVDGQNPWVHCQYHAQLVTQTVQAFEQGQIDGAQLVPILTVALDNMAQHGEQLNQDPTREQEAAYVRQFIQQNNGTLQQQEQKLIAEMQRQQDAQQQQGEPMSGEEQRKWESHQQDIQIRQQEFLMRQRELEQKLQLQEQDAQATRRQKDLALAADIAEKRAKLQQQKPTIE